MPTKEFKALLRRLGKSCSENEGLDEREIVTLFAEQGFFSELGYEKIGEDLRLEKRVKKGRVDVLMRGFTGRPICVIEFKGPHTDLPAHRAQLEEYARDLLPDYAVLTDGVEFRLYRRQGEALVAELEPFSLAEANEAQASKIYQVLHKRAVDWRRLPAVREALQECAARPIRITSPEGEGGRIFLRQFALAPQVAFGRLAKALAEILPICIKRSGFARGAYAFWEKIYARRLSENEVEKLARGWKDLIGKGKGKQKVYQFMFALETAYAILSRLMLAKAMQDARFPDLNAVRAFERELDARDRHGVLGLSAYVTAVQAIFAEGKQQAFSSLFDSDIFDWWLDLPELGEVAGDALEALAEATLAVLQFDFAGLSGDLLGQLYQSYFDPETRKALGEFYTPPEVVEFILDQVGYKGPSIRTKRLLDPACGSGTFLVHALQRYLQASKSRDPRSTLQSLIDGLRIVGFDINPFAVLMSQVNYALHLLPLYAEVLQHDPEFEIPLLPVFRTDSLRQEKREGEKEVIEEQSGMRGFTFEAKGDIAKIKTELPVEIKPGEFLKLDVPVPRYDRARDYGYVDNVEEYFRAQHAMFEAVRQASKRGAAAPDFTELEGIFTELGLGHAAELARYVQPSAEKIIQEIERLRTEYQDGRFLRTLEDLALAMTLKHELQYDFVVGNPPYVRIQNIPELLRKYWQGIYDWAEGSFDIYIPFIERAVVYWLKEGGQLGFICSNRFLLANYATKLREWLPQLAEVELIFDMRDTRVFQDALNYPAILVVKRTDSPQQEEFIAARVFADPDLDGDEGPRALLDEAQTLIRCTKRGEKHVEGEHLDAFTEQIEHLTPQGWYLMPPEERRVFRKLEEAATHRLHELTLTQSGGFAGYQTSADDIFVLKLIEDRGNILRLKPKGGEDPVEIEKKLLRPWLFGRDVERWHIAWDGWYVLFPYAKIDGAYRLIPSNEYEDKFDYADRAPRMKDFPKAWDYLTSHEESLRCREGGMFSKGSPREHLWYGATYPRSIDLYELPKLLYQNASPHADIAFDDEGRIFQHGEGGGGVGGLVPNLEEVDPHYLLSLMNSSVLDYFLKHVALIYAGKSYSYSARFLQNLPIYLVHEDKFVKDLAALAQELIKTKEQLRAKERERNAFPEPQIAKLKERPEIYPLLQLVQGEPRAAKIRVEDISLQEQLDGHWAMTFGRTMLVFLSEAHARVAEQWLHVQGKAQVSSSEFMKLKLPASEQDCRRLLTVLEETEKEIEALRKKLRDGEAEVDELVAKLYGLNKGDRKVIREFLERF